MRLQSAAESTVTIVPGTNAPPVWDTKFTESAAKRDDTLATVSPGTIVYRKGAVADTVVRDPSTTERTPNAPIETSATNTTKPKRR